MGDYTIVAISAALAVVGLELLWLRTGLLRRRAYLVTIVIVLGFQVGVDGWLTKLSSPIVSYGHGHFSGLRFPWDIPVEDFLFGFALVTFVLLLWERAGSGPPAPGERMSDERPGRRTEVLEVSDR